MLAEDKIFKTPIKINSPTSYYFSQAGSIWGSKLMLERNILII